MFQITADMVKVHDMQYMACNPGMYNRLGKPDHRSCATNVAEAMTDFLRESGARQTGFAWNQVHDPFNIFQNTPDYSLRGHLDPSRMGDYLELKAEMDVGVALSCCPYTEDGFNGGRSTDVAVCWEQDY